MVVERMYIPMPDGVELAVTIARPDGPGRVPVLLNYDPYGAGSLSESFGQPGATFFVPHGYVFMTASIRGTGCSGGQYDQVFSTQEAADGAYLVQWAAGQGWSTGKVGLTGASYPGIDQYFVAALRPPGLAAIAPFETIGDIYRDVTDPGGVPNPVFSQGWTLALQPGLSAENGPGTDLPRGDTTCARHVAGQAANDWRGNAGFYVAAHPTDDDWYTTRSPKSIVSRIDVPVFMANAWQDHQVGSRGLFLYNMINAPKKLSVSNGLHNTPRSAPLIRDQLLRWFDRWLKDDTTNGIMEEPPVTVLLETDEQTFQPSSVVRSSSWPLDDTAFTPLYLRAGGALDWSAPMTDEVPDAYVTPGPAQSKTAHDGIMPVGGLTYTTAPFASDVMLAGPAELELSAAITGVDTDWYVSLSAVDADANVTYVTKGLLRASHRGVDGSRSLPGRPYHFHTNPQLVQAGETVDYRVEFLPFAQPFRAGTRLRLDFLTPSALSEPWWGYEANPVPTVNLVQHSAASPSRLLLPVVPSPALPPAPPCGSVIGQPCGIDPNSF
jgi:hypothetical protein